MKNEEQQQAPENEKDIAKKIQEKAFKGGQNKLTTHQSNIKAPEAPQIELPKGGGALRSIGEKFEANPVTGTASISVPIAISPGRSGFQPQLALSYNSGGANGIFGMGWSVGLGSISRKTQKGIPLYDDANESDVYLFAGIEDLVPISTANGSYKDATENFQIQCYQPRIEGSFFKIERWTRIADGDIHWRVTDTNNVTSILGESNEARIYDSLNPSKIAEWKIERKYDSLGNCIQYNYFRENTTNVNNGPAEYNRLNNGTAFNQLYPRSIQYGNSVMYNTAEWANNKWYFEVIFNYGEDDSTYPINVNNSNINWSQRQDSFSNFRYGFEIRTYRLCRKVLMYHHFEGLNNNEALLVKSTEINYHENEVGTQIESVSHHCYDETDNLAYPPVSFSYTQASPDNKIYTLKNSDLKNLPQGIDGQNYSFADPKGEGISGILTETANAWYFKPNLGHDNFYEDHPADYSPEPIGSFGPLETLNQKPNIASATSLQDINGDGKPEAVIREPHLAGYYKQNEQGEWSDFQYFDNYPNLNFQSEDIRFIDLNGDGRADILITKQDTLEWIAYEDNDVCKRVEDRKERIGYGKTTVISRALNEEQGPRVVFSNGEQNIFLTDMTGDGLSDLVRIENGSICYWPNKGFGHFGAKIVLKNVPTFDYSDQFSANRIRLGDIDGSGTTDILYLGNKGTRYFINQAGNALAEGVELSTFPRKDDVQHVQLADILGNGTACLVWSSSHEKDKPNHIKYMDLMGGQKPYLLEEMDNGMGALRKFSYVPSTKFYLRDKQAGTPWITKLSFPVQVLERVEVFEQITQSRFVSRYAYHHGYYDPIEKEFRGFGMVEQWDTENYEQFNETALYQIGSNALDEQSHTEPIYTKTWFHNGYYAQKERIENQYATEYWQGDSAAFSLTQHQIPENLSANAVREAYRALKGSSLRQEVYGLSPEGDPGTPYSVSESRYRVFQLQEQGSNRFGVFRTELQESFSYAYEQNASDPRIGQQILLESNEYGHPLKSVSIAYPRRGSGHVAEQSELRIVYSENSFINQHPAPQNEILNDTNYRLGIGSTEQVWEYRPLTNIALPISVDGLLDDISNATVISIENDFTGVEAEKRLITKANVHYYNQGLTGALPLGQVANHALAHHTERLALTHEKIEAIFNETGITRIDPNSAADQAKLTEAGYVQYANEWWIPSGIISFDAEHFYLPIKSEDVFGNSTDFTYDDFDLFPIKVTDPYQNIVNAEIDYVHLQPTMMTDPNGNRQQVVLDALGMPVKSLVMGKDSSHPNYVLEEGDTLEDPSLLFEYDLFQFYQLGKPNYSRTIQRETHANSNNSTNETRTDITFSDGLGKEIQIRSQFGEYQGENNAETKVVVNGQQITNNKDWVIEQYEPYFDEGFDYRYIRPYETLNGISLVSLGSYLEEYQQQFPDDWDTPDQLRDFMNNKTGFNLSSNQEWIDELVKHDLLLDQHHFKGQEDVSFGQPSKVEVGTGDFSIEAWVYREASSSTITVLANQKQNGNTFSGIAFLVFSDGSFAPVLADAHGPSSQGYAYIKSLSSIPIKEWAHLAFVRNGNNSSNWKLFMNGQELNCTHVNTLGNGNIENTGVEDWKIGSRRGSVNNQNFKGYIENVRLYHRQLTVQEIAQNAARGILGEPSSSIDLSFHAVSDQQMEPFFTDLSSSPVIGSFYGTPDLSYLYNEKWEDLAIVQSNPVSTQRIKLSYDVLGRNVKTDYADGTFEKVEFDAWQQKNYDRNDTVMDSQWYTDRNSPDPMAANAPNDAEERAAYLAARHHNTPQQLLLDNLGRVFQSTAHNRTYDWDSTAALFVVTNSYYNIKIDLDLQGKQLQSTNALGQITAFDYDLLPLNEQGNGNIMYTNSPDGGWRRLLTNAVGNSIQTWNARGHTSRSEYDKLLRPTKSYVDEGNGEQLVGYTLYGCSVEMEEAPEQANLRGQVVRAFDQSGMSSSLIFDFKDNPVKGKTNLAFEYKSTIDWEDLSSATTLVEVDTLATELYLELDESHQPIDYINQAEFDALNRPLLLQQADGSTHRPTYNKADLLNKVEVQLNHEAEFTEHVSNITYNARGQRMAIYYGNNTKTRYDYDTSNFRLTRLLTTRNNGQDILQDLNYTFDPVGNIVEQVDHAQQTHYFNNSVITPVGKYEYDALYRLIKASGREKESLAAPSSAIYVPEALPTNGKSNTIMSNYSESYEYDALGNVLKLTHQDTSTGTGSWTRNYVYNTSTPNNYLQAVYTGGAPPPSAQFSYDAHGNLVEMTHLEGMIWDFQDQLQATVKNDERTYYVYSGGQRIRKVTVNTSSGEEIIKNERIYLGAYELYKEYEDPSATSLERASHHVSDDTGRIALLEVKTKNEGNSIEPEEQRTISRYQYGNHLGSACLELNEQAEILSYQEFHPFGSTAYSMHSNDAEISLKRYQYNAKERDEETGLDYYGARYYASWLCRFISVDPLKDQYPFQNSYAYAANSPITMTDANGENPTDPGGDEEPSSPSAWGDYIISLVEENLLEYLTMPDQQYQAGLLTGFTGEAANLGQLIFRATEVGKFVDQLMGNQTLGDEISNGISSLVEALSTEEGRDVFFEGLGMAIEEFYENATFENGAFQAGVSHGGIILGAVISLLTGGGGTAVKLLQAIKQGPKAVARVLRSAFKSPTKTPSKSVDDVAGSEFDSPLRMSEQAFEAAKKFGNSSIDELLDAGDIIGKNGLSDVGRALQKHGSRPGSAFPKAKGNPTAINEQGRNVLESLLKNPEATSVTRHHARFGDILEVKLISGQGARFSSDGRKFIGFIEP